MLITSRNVAFILISSMVSDYFDQLQAEARDISEAFDRVWHAGLLRKRKPHGIIGEVFGLISFFCR